jgi:hypothetical protein
VAAQREDWKLETFHSSEIKTTDEMGKALKLARQLAHWCESVEFHAKEMAVKEGAIPSGFKIQQRQGNRFIPSVSDAFGRMAMPQGEFLKACEVKFSRLVEVVAELNGLKKAQAERDVERKLAEAITRKPSSVSLVAVK